MLTEYLDHYNTHRPHRALQQLPPLDHGRLTRGGRNATVQRTEILGGLINEYRRAA